VLAIAPTTAPNVFNPYSNPTPLRYRSSALVTARAAAESVPPMRIVGRPNTIAARSNRTAVAPTTPKTICPPNATYAVRLRSISHGVNAVPIAMPSSSAA